MQESVNSLLKSMDTYALTVAKKARRMILLLITAISINLIMIIKSFGVGHVIVLFITGLKYNMCGRGSSRAASSAY